MTGLRVEACGDAHVGNFGKFATPGRNMIFDINDFDETLPGPWEWDVKRLGGEPARRRASNGASRPTTRDHVVAAAVRAYRKRMAEAADDATLDLWYARTHIDDVIAHFPPKYRPRVERDVAQGAPEGPPTGCRQADPCRRGRHPIRRGPAAGRPPRQHRSRAWTTIGPMIEQLPHQR